MRRAAMALFLLASLAGLPGATAQAPPPDVSMTLDDHEGLLMPETDSAQLQIVVRLTCNGFEAPLGPMTVALTVKEQPDYATTLIENSLITKRFQPGECQPSQPWAFQSRL